MPETCPFSLPRSSAGNFTAEPLSGLQQDRLARERSATIESLDASIKRLAARLENEASLDLFWSTLHSRLLQEQEPQAVALTLGCALAAVPPYRLRQVVEGLHVRYGGDQASGNPERSNPDTMAKDAALSCLAEISGRGTFDPARGKAADILSKLGEVYANPDMSASTSMS